MMVWEINLAIEGYQKRIERQRELLAGHALWVARTTWSKRPIGIHDLLGTKKKEEPVPLKEKFSTVREWRAHQKEEQRKKDYAEWLKKEETSVKSEALAYLKFLEQEENGGD